MNAQSQVWWALEAELRKDLSQPISLAVLQRVSRRSMRNLAHACHHAVGMSPMHRIKQNRLSMARDLVLHSELRFSEIAARIGYPRVREFSRDYHRQFKLTPTEDREKGPDYKQLRSRATQP